LALDYGGFRAGLFATLLAAEKQANYFLVSLMVPVSADDAGLKTLACLFSRVVISLAEQAAVLYRKSKVFANY